MFFDTMKLYGKEPEQLDSVTRMFMFVLADYPYEKISEALRFYSKHYNEMPAPADIVTIIERGNKPPFDKAVYAAISQIDARQRSSDEWAYMRDYERFMVRGQY